MSKIYDDLINTYSAKYCLEIEIIKALIQVESSFNPMAYRYEPKFYERYIKNKRKFLNHPLYHDPRAISASYGLHQVMLTTFEEFGLGMVSDPEILYDPELNIKFGCKILRKKVNQYGLELGILAYNSGSPCGNDPSKEPNYKYLKKIAKAYKKFGGTNLDILKHVS